MLHTWTQDLRVHIHANALIAAGALDRDRQRQWVEPKRGPRFLFPVTALSKVFAGKFCEQLQAAQRDGRLSRDAERTTSEERQHRLRALRSKAWVVYAKTPMAGPPLRCWTICRGTRIGRRSGRSAW